MGLAAAGGVGAAGMLVRQTYVSESFAFARRF
jgi:hypothetical protein